jgi:MraZ protein
MYPGKLDEKGRIKLPAPFQQYFGALEEKRLFVTSVNRSTAQIYTLDAWRHNERFFESYRDDPMAAQDVAFIANDLGAEAEMDAQGRITFPPELRRELELENQPVRLFAYKGHVEVLSEKLYEARKKQAERVTAEAVAKLHMAGLN